MDITKIKEAKVLVNIITSLYIIILLTTGILINILWHISLKEAMFLYKVAITIIKTAIKSIKII